MGHELSRTLSYLLRHGANEAGLTMDAAGWVPVHELMRHLDVTHADLEAAVRSNTKGRLELRTERIRCCQGHSTAGTPVTVEALEASWRAYDREGSVWHGTHLDVIEPISREGILPQQRTHVHLAPTLDSHVGKRGHIHVALEVSIERLRTAGIDVFEAGNGVVLARRIPPGAITAVLTFTRRATRQAEGLRALLGLNDPSTAP